MKEPEKRKRLGELLTVVIDEYFGRVYRGVFEIRDPLPMSKCPLSLVVDVDVVTDSLDHWSESAVFGRELGDLGARKICDITVLRIKDAIGRLEQRAQESGATFITDAEVSRLWASGKRPPVRDAEAVPA